METKQYYYTGGTAKKRNKTASRWFWGLFFLAAGAAIFINQLGIFSLFKLSLGHIIWSVLLLVILIKSITHKFWFGIFLPLFFLIWIYSDLLGITANFSWWPVFGASVLLSIGFSILFRPKKGDWYSFGVFQPESEFRSDEERGRSNNSQTVYAEAVENTEDGEYANASNGNSDDSNNNYDSSYGTGGASGASDNNSQRTTYSETSSDGSETYARASFGSAIKYVNSDNFKRAVLSCSFGAIKMYFDNSKIPSGNAEINIDASFCGIELFIPNEWQVSDEMEHILGGVSEKNPRRQSGNGPTVRLTGSMKFSGIEIIYI